MTERVVRKWELFGSVGVSYGSTEDSADDLEGKEYTDKVTISDDLVIEKQSIGVASKAKGYVAAYHLVLRLTSNAHSFNGFDGILGWAKLLRSCLSES